MLWCCKMAFFLRSFRVDLPRIGKSLVSVIETRFKIVDMYTYNELAGVTSTYMFAVCSQFMPLVFRIICAYFADVYKMRGVLLSLPWMMFLLTLSASSVLVFLSVY